MRTRDVCSVASRAKGYQALPLLTVHRRRAGGEPGNEARYYMYVATVLLPLRTGVGAI